MKIYGDAWATAIVNEWEQKNPRVKLMLSRFSVWAAQLGVAKPKEWVKKRAVYHLRRAKIDCKWNYIKTKCDMEIHWRYLFSEFWIPSSKPDWNHLFDTYSTPEFDLDPNWPSAKSPIDGELSTAHNEARPDSPEPTGGKASL